MTKGLKAVAFAGPGTSTTANTAKLLEDFFPEDEDIQAIFVPDKILRGQKGLKGVVSWLDEEIGEEGKGYQTAPKIALISKLKEAENNGGVPFLVFLPPEDGELDSKDEELLSEAQENGISIKDLTEGLDDLILGDDEDTSDEAEEPQEAVSRRGRGKSRNTSRSVTPEADEAQVEAEGLAPLTKSGGSGGPGFLEESIFQFVKDKLIEEGFIKPAKEKSYPAWCNADGSYRPRIGRGRGKKGEEKVDLTEEDAKKIPGLIEEFEEAAAE